jgi:hypothetical protein
MFGFWLYYFYLSGFLSFDLLQNTCLLKYLESKASVSYAVFALIFFTYLP